MPLYILPAEVSSLVFQNLPAYTQTWLSVSEVAIQISFDLKEIQPELKFQVVSESVSITHSVSWSLGKKKLLQDYKCFKAWSSVSNVKFKACWGRPDDVIGGKLLLKALL